jgi:transposase-like protein
MPAGIIRIKKPLQQTLNILNAPNSQAAKAILKDLLANGEVSNPSFKELNGQLEDLTIFFEFPQETRKIIYTINLIENLNVKIRKYTKIHCLSYR